jgi:hypothetical protein
MTKKKWSAPVYFDGKNLKSMNPWDVDSNTGWNVISGDDAPKGIDAYFRSVPWLYRAVIDRSNNVGKMPFAIMAGGKEYDTSTDYANKLEWLDDPTTLFKKVEMSLAMCGRAYLKLDINSSGYIKKARYLVPTSITEHYDEAGEIDYYERSIKSSKIRVPPAEIVPIYLPDYQTENGPGKSAPAIAALISAGVMYNADAFVSKFFERGAIKATVLTTKGFSQPEAERMQHWWDDVVAGIKNAWSAIVVKGEEVKPVVIGEGLESLTNESLITERRQNIATALGVPESRMWSAAANYATRVQDDKAYYEGTIIPDCDLIVEAFNKQIFTPEHNLEGYSLVFQTETLDVFQVDAAEQASALAQLTDKKMPLLMALDLLGFDLTDEQRKELEQLVKDQQAQADQIAQAAQAKPAEQVAPAETPANNAPIPAQGNDLGLWQKKALKRLKEGKSPACEFVSNEIPQDENERIHAALADCGTPDEIKAVFADADDAPIDITYELKRANDWLYKHGDVKAVESAPVKPGQQFIISGYDEAINKMSIETSNNVKAIIASVDNLVLTIGNHQAAIDQIQETIGNVRKELDMDSTVTQSIVAALERISEKLANQSAQPAPVVNVPPANITVEVAPTPVMVTQEAQPPRMLEVVRDGNGRITGIREK